MEFFSKLLKNIQWHMAGFIAENYTWNGKTWFFAELVNLPSLLLTALILWKLSQIFLLFKPGKGLYTSYILFKT